MIWLKRIWNLVLLILRLIGYLAAVVVYAVGWGICQVIFHLLRWADDFRLKERCKHGFEFLKNGIVGSCAKLKKGILHDWKPIFSDESDEIEIIDIDAHPATPEPAASNKPATEPSNEPVADAVNEPIVAEPDDTPEEIAPEPATEPFLKSSAEPGDELPKEAN